MPGGSIGTIFCELDLDPSRFVKSQAALYKDATSTALNIEENFKKLGIHSAAEMDLMRAKITNAYNMIAHSSKATANDILRAEEAKNSKLKELNEQQFGHQTSLIEKIKANWIGIAGTIYAAMKFERMIEGWIKLDMAQQQANNSLRAAMIANDRYSKSFYENTLKQADALQRLTGYQDQEIMRGQKMLMIYDNIGNDMIPRVTKVMLDLAALMDKDVQGAAAQLGKASEGITEGLRKMGIVIDENIYKQKGFVGVLDELEKMLAGQAESMVEGAGKWKILGIQVGETKEKLGEFFTLIADKSGFIAILSESINAFSESIEGLNEALKGESLTKLAPLLLAITGGGAAGPLGAAGGYLVGKGLQGIFDPKELNEISTHVGLQKMIDELYLPPDQLYEAQKRYHAEYLEYLNELQKGISLLTPEYQKARAAIYEMLEAFKDPATAEYKKELKALYEEFKPIRQQLGETAEVTNAWNLRLTELQKKHGIIKEVTDLTANYKTIINQLNRELAITANNEKILSTFFERKVGGGFAEIIRPVGELDFTNFYKEQLNLFKKYGVFIEKNIDKVEDEWVDVTENMADVGRDAFSDFLMDFTFDFEDMAKGIRRVWADAIADMAKEKFIKPMMQQMMGEIQGFMPGAAVPGVTSTQGQSFGGIAMGALGAGAMGYGLGESASPGTYAGVGAGVGAAVGSIFPGIGTLVGGIVGGAIGSIFKKAAEEIKDKWSPSLLGFDLIASSINDEITYAIDSWQGSSPHAEIGIALAKVVKSQKEFFEEIANWVGAEVSNVQASGTFIQSGIGDLSSQLQAYEEGMSGKIAYEWLNANKAILESLSGKWGEEALDTFFKDTINPIILGNREKIESYWETIYMNLKTTQDDWDNLRKELISSNVMSEAEFYKHLGNEWEKIEFMFGEEWSWGKEDKYKLLEDLYAELKSLLQEPEWYTGIEKELSSFYPEFLEKIQQTQQIISSVISSAFNNIKNDLTSMLDSGFSDANYKIFTDNIKKGLADSFIDLIQQDVIEKQLQGMLFQPFIGEAGITSLLMGYQTKEYSLTDVFAGLTNMFENLESTFVEMQPVFEILATGIEGLKESINYNSLATADNTNAILDQLNQYLQELTTGGLAPALSAETMMNTYYDLLSQAQADSSKIDEFAAYAMGNFLNFFKGYGGDYQSYWQMVVDAINRLSGTISGTLPENYGYAPIPIGDYSDPVNPYRSKSINLNLYIDGEQLSRSAFKYAERNQDSVRKIRRMAGVS